MAFWKDLIEARQEARQKARPEAMRQTLLRRQKELCFWCRGRMRPRDRTLDHVLPHSLGGPYVLANLVLVHQKCNERRGSRFSDHLLNRLTSPVLALAIENLQTLRADTYEAASENQARVLELRREMETKLWSLLIQRLDSRHQNFMKDREPTLQRRRKVKRQRQFNRSEKDFQKLTEELWKSKIGQRIRRFEKKEKLVERPVKQLVVVRRSKSGRR